MSTKRTMTITDKLYRDRYKVDEDSHLWIKDQNMCVKCPFNFRCIRVCPTNVLQPLAALFRSYPGRLSMLISVSFLFRSTVRELGISGIGEFCAGMSQ